MKPLPTCSAIIAASGSGSRMGAAVGSRSKVFLELSPGLSVLKSAILNVLRSDSISELVVMARASDCDEVREILASLDEYASIPKKVLPGGNTRQETVELGMLAIENESEIILVHDGARPFPDPVLVRRAIELAAEEGAAILVEPSKATLKRVHQNKIYITLTRSKVWEAQTPQCFRADLLQEAFKQAKEDGFTGTDESQLVERIEFPVSFVPSPDRNLKITTEFDLRVARLLLDV